MRVPGTLYYKDEILHPDIQGDGMSKADDEIIEMLEQEKQELESILQEGLEKED
jgi:hypothetical protein